MSRSLVRPKHPSVQRFGRRPRPGRCGDGPGRRGGRRRDPGGAGVGGKVRLLPKQVKLFADGAIISQLMQMRSPYLDDGGHPDLCHHGEWMMQPDTFRAFAGVLECGLAVAHTRQR